MDSFADMQEALFTSTMELGDPLLLNKIDKLFACGVGDYIDLPQLVVVGDQSSGKSSVLEGLTRLPFPRDKSLCTRFATQITFRRSPVTKLHVSVIPSKNASQKHQDRLKAWSYTQVEDLTPERFQALMEEVKCLMNIVPSENETTEISTFSEDVLRIERHGPKEDHLSVVDVPGIFRVVTDGVTTETDIGLVKRMVEGYMKNPRSVLLAVVSANIDVATQDILTRAKEYDKENIRTIGILTKPDLVDEDAEQPVVDLLQGRSHKMKLGWCIVKNASQRELAESSFDRDSSEQNFFRRHRVWNKLDQKRLGIASLRMRLEEILGDHIRREFPRVQAEVRMRLETSKADLAKLGTRRGTTQEQRAFLMEICHKFQELTASALSANYAASPHFHKNLTLRLPTNAVSRGENFDKQIATQGHAYDLNQSHRDEEADDVGNSSDDSDVRGAPVRTLDDSFSAEDIEDLLLDSRTRIDEDLGVDTIAWLRREYESSRGIGIGTIDINLLANIMKTQTAKWEPIALGYISDIIQMVHCFVKKLLDILCITPRLRGGLYTRLFDELVACYRNAYEHTKFLLEVERGQNPYTFNHYFNSNLQKSRQARLVKQLQGKVQESGRGSYLAAFESLDDVYDLSKDMQNVEHIATELCDILSAYYKVARKRFVDNVCVQSAYRFLLHSSAQDTPLKIFSPTWVGRLTDAELEEIAGEDNSVKVLRKELEEMIDNLEEARKILR